MRRKENFPIPFLAIFLILVPFLGGCGGGTNSTNDTSAGTIKLAWDAPTTNEDGSPLTDLAGYKIYYGIASPDEHSIDVGNVTTYTLTGLTPGQTYIIAATAYDASGNESEKCPPVSGPAN